MNALGIQQLHPGQGLYAPVAPPVTSASGSARYPEPYPSTSRAAGATSPYPAPGHANAPTMATSVSVSGSRHRDVLQNYGTGISRAPHHMYRPSSTPTGPMPMLSSWTAPDISNPSLNSLGLSAPGQGVNGSINSQAQPTARDSVSSWGTADSLAGPAHNDLFSTLRPLASAPADSGLPASDLLPRPDGQLLGVVRGRSTQIASPRPQFPQAPMQPVFVASHPDRDTDSRPRSRRSHHSRSQSRTSLVSNRDPSQHSAPRSFTPEDRGFSYLPPHPRSVPIPYVRLAQPPLDLNLNLTLYRRSTRLSPRYQLRNQLLRFHARLRIPINPFSTVLPLRNHRIQAIAHTIDLPESQ
ncbi:hypothetical protein BGW80DRAFT_99016 [Lactifluus volemus]|nr:hypothetical protein BGW80DRAFT_99016 [Lactifluus volemus]